MKNTKGKKHTIILIIAIIALFMTAASSLLFAKDTDIYEVTTKQNCYILQDNSASMDFGVYEQNIDYERMFNYFFDLNEAGPCDADPSTSVCKTYIHDTVMNSNHFRLDANKKERHRIYLLKGNIGVTKATVDGETVLFTGDAADPNYIWYTGDIVDTHTDIDSDGNLSDDGTSNQRITVDANGYILLDGVRLPLSQDIKLKDIRTMYDGTQVDAGFGGLLNAPGYYFSGYEGVDTSLPADPGDLDVVEGGETTIYFFVTGNWINMQMMYNLHYVTNNPDPTGASTGDMAWKYEPYAIPNAADWPELDYSVSYPVSGQYDNNVTEEVSLKTITHPGAAKIQVHFSAFDVKGDNQANQFKKDYVVIYDGEGNEIAKYDEDNDPTDGDGWSATIEDETVRIALVSDNSIQGNGYTIDKIRIYYGDYLMQNRLDISKDAILYVIDAFKGKMNWGYASFQYTSGSGNGATINAALNPNLTDDQNRAAIIGKVEGESPQSGGTPLGEALQDVFEKGYWTKRSALDNLGCRKNYIISVTDGFPSEDDDWTRITDTGGDPDLPFQDWDGDQWTSDPYQPPTSPNYYDDVGHWMYTHSWKSDTKDAVPDPANSYDNVITHHISFGADHPLLKDAAGESGGEYVVAYNKEQLVAAFYSLALKMTEAVSFTSPVVSIDAANKIQNGDDLYLGLFLPQDNLAWMGNIKKFRLGDGSTDRPKLSMLYDAANNEAIDATGQFMDNTNGFWGDDTDANDSDNYGSADVTEDGVGEVLKERVETDFANGTYWDRPIYTWNSTLSSMLKVKYDTLTAADLGVADDATRDKVLNYLYGYTYDADAATHAPSATRDWVLGAIVHSRPVVVEYYDPANLANLLKRYIVVGANDGMLHVFDDSTGQEVLAFVPPDMLTTLQNLPDTPFVDTVDGNILLFRKDTAPKYLIFGERRGGAKFWCLNVTDTNPLNWTVQWDYANSEILQSWSEPFAAKLPYSVVGTTGERKFKDVLIITGGYDTEEDSYPEPFSDIDYSGSPYKNTGTVDGAEWDKNNAAQDVNGNNTYDTYNPGIDGHGRGIFIFDIDDPTAVTNDDNGVKLLPFAVKYDATTDSTTVDGANGATQTRTDMKYCFPASPSIVTDTIDYLHKDGNGDLTESIVTKVLKTVYAVDIYTNVYRIDYDFDVTESGGTYSASENTWSVNKIFSGNPASANASGNFDNTASTDPTDQGRKAFYPPEISWGGSCTYFSRGNYRFGNTEFYGTDEIATLFFGTGDREHPTYKLARNRVYAVYDDSRVTAVYDPDNTKVDKRVTGIGDPAKTPRYYTEVDLLNLSYDELDNGSSTTAAQKEALREILRDEPYYDNFTTLEEGYAHEDDAKGWYIILEDQTDKDSVDHSGEKILSKPSLFAGVLYFTSYQPSIFDSCSPQGNGLAYSLNYCDGTAAYNLDTTNDNSVSDTVQEVSDRYFKKSNIFGIPSGFSIIMRQGQAYAMTMMGGDILGPKMTGDPLVDPDFTIKGPEFGLNLYYWKEGISQ